MFLRLFCFECPHRCIMHFPLFFLADIIFPQPKIMEMVYKKSLAGVSKFPQLNKFIHRDLVPESLKHGVSEL